MPRKVENWNEHIVRYVDASDLLGCWPWTGSRANGRGKVTGFLGTRKAHRATYALAFGVLPTQELDHVCNNPICVNPWHLEPVTRGENNRRYRLSINPLHDTAYPCGHAREGRYCRTCKNKTNRKYMETYVMTRKEQKRLYDKAYRARINGRAG